MNLRGLAIVAVAALFASACSAATVSPSPASSLTTQSVGETSSPSTSPPGGVDSNSVLSDEQAAALRVESLRERAVSLGLKGYEPPELVRWINIVDYPAVGAQCLTEAGFPSVAENGVVRTKQLTQSQAKAVEMARLDCDAKFSVHPYYNLPPSPTAIGKRYDWLVGKAVPCLERHGLSVTAAPTRETFVSTPAESQRWPWDEQVEEQIAQRFDREGQARLDRECPMNPGLTVFNEHDPVPRSS